MDNDPVSSISELPKVVVAKGYMKFMNPFFKKKKKKNTRGPPPTPTPCERKKNIPHHGDRSFEGKNYTQFFGGWDLHELGKKWAQNAPFASVFQNFSRGDPAPPYCEKIKIPLFGFSSTAKVKNFPHHVYRRSEIWKQTFWGKKSTRTRQKWATNAPFASVFQNFSRGDPDPPPPLLREDKNVPSLAFPQQLRWKFSHITYIKDRRFESKNYTQFFGKKSTRTRQK